MLRATALALTLIGVFSASASATGLKATQIVEVATVTVDADGLETRTYSEATDVEPGEQVRYSLAYINEGAAAADNVNLVMPVPSAVTYIEGSANGTVVFSADEGQSYAPRDALMVGEGPGERLATSDEITHIKWAFDEPIAVAETGTVSFEAILK